MSTTVPLLPLWAFMSCCRANFTYLCLYRWGFCKTGLWTGMCGGPYFDLTVVVFVQEKVSSPCRGTYSKLPSRWYSHCTTLSIFQLTEGSTQACCVFARDQKKGPVSPLCLTFYKMAFKSRSFLTLWCSVTGLLNLVKPTGHVMYQQFNN